MFPDYCERSHMSATACKIVGQSGITKYSNNNYDFNDDNGKIIWQNYTGTHESSLKELSSKFLLHINNNLQN